MKKILLIATGGTIACKLGESGLAPVMTADEILSYVPEINSFCVAEGLQLFNIDSTNVTPDHWRRIVGAIRENYSRYDGFVVLHGTDTMAYTAAVLSYMIQNSGKPIVLTGSQKPINSESTDARNNLYDSILYCAADGSSGVQIVFDGKVILGSRAKKTHSKSYNAFESINYPCLAVIQDGTIMRYISSSITGGVKFFDDLDPKVGVYKLIPGASADLLDACFRVNDAVIIESFGTGGIPDGEGLGFYDVIGKWSKKGKIVVSCTQVENGGSDMTVYKVGKNVKEKFDMIESYDMTSEATVAKLMWILGFERDRAAVRRLFYTPVGKDILYTGNNG